MAKCHIVNTKTPFCAILHVMETDVKTTLRIPASLHEALTLLAHEDNRSLNGQVVYILKQYVRTNPPTGTTAVLQITEAALHVPEHPQT